MNAMTDAEKAQFVLGVYFRTQAAIEKYMGAERLPEWTEYMAGITAESTRKRLPDPADQARSLLDGLASMLDVYGSDHTVTESDGTRHLEVRRCGIYDYRERVQKQGVELTLKRPCEFCVDFRYRTAEHLGATLSHELADRGCSWTCRTGDSPVGD
ncbi:hypothetical protein [Streptomyces anandii]|uniref:hypothetical protein n=1 Tax=Streptomyces anandii TaxID=285454 RepID=UPI000A5B93E4|nr:hypothetical protein [Streptomyces anandii]GGX81584.1 hypothetical protein GCM10010510_28270 [Streptomyces anandii JCM 4720]